MPPGVLGQFIGIGVKRISEHVLTLEMQPGRLVIGDVQPRSRIHKEYKGIMDRGHVGRDVLPRSSQFIRNANWYKVPVVLVTIWHRLNMELFYWAPVTYSCTHWLWPRNSPLLPPHLGSYEGHYWSAKIDDIACYMDTSERAEVASSRMARAGSWCNRRIKARRCCSPGDSISYLTIKSTVSDPDSLRYGSRTSIFCWIPFRIRIQSGSRVLITKN